METLQYKTPRRTEIIRTTVAGPKPCNTLAFIRCEGAGGLYEANSGFGDLVQYKIRFPTMFRVDGFVQANHAWYRANTLVSATAFVQILNVSTDISFVFAVDSVTADITEDGSLAFEVQLAQQINGQGFGEKLVEAVFNYEVSAYVLVYEPRVEPPPPGNLGKELFFDREPPRLEKKLAKKKEIFVTDEARLSWKVTP